MSITLTAAQLKEALEFANPDESDDEEQMETEVSIQYLEGRTSIDGEFMPAGYYCWITDYPDEGVHGPLGVPNEEVIRLQEENAAQLREANS